MTFLNGSSNQLLSTKNIIHSLTQKSVIRIGTPFSTNQHNLEQFATNVLSTTSTLTTLQLLDTATTLHNESFRKALAQNATITFLNLRHSNCDDEGAIALATILKTNSTLQTISLNDNRIRDIGAKALAEALEVNRTLEKLYLNDNLVGEEGAMALMDVGSRRGGGRTLLQISLRGNNFEDEEGEEALVDALFEVDESEEEEEMVVVKSLPTKITDINKIRQDGQGTTNDDDDTNMLDPQTDINTLLAERKLMMQQLDNLSTDRTEARDELAAKDAILRMKDDKIATQREQFDRYKREVEKVAAEKEVMMQQLKDKLATKNADSAAKDAELKMKIEEIVNLHKQELQRLEDKIASNNANATAKGAAKDAELTVKLEAISNLHKQELGQTEAARVAAENKAASKDAELTLTNHLVMMKDAEIFQLRSQLSIQQNELAAKIMVERQQSMQLVDKLNVDVARAKASEFRKGAELKKANELLKMKDEELSSLDVELSNHRKQLNAYINEMSTKDNELKKKHEELSDQISDNEQLRKRLDEMKCQVGQLSAQNAELVTRESNLKKINEDLSAEKTQLSAQVESLNERI
eukprot:scaffold15947_cov140-Skeletonema_menzelii.AAC.3